MLIISHTYMDTYMDIKYDYCFHIQMAKVELDNLPEFCNLTHLKIGSCQDFYFVSSIIQHSPHLKHLIFDKVSFNFEDFMIT